jgi:serine phosphatase RsbU (regulator of sigma subunit)
MVKHTTTQMRRAAELQASMMPSSRPRSAGFEIAAHFTTCEISGDFYDWYRTGGGRLVLTLGDVAGKGLQAR